MKYSKPFPLSAMLLWSLILGNIGGAYLLIWRNLQLTCEVKETEIKSKFDLALHGWSILGLISLLTLSYLVTGLVHIFPVVG